MAVLGEPLDAMVQNLGQTDNGFVDVGGASAKVVSQGFRTGTNEFGYRVKGIGVEIEGSGSNFPDGPTSVSVSVHANSNGQPGRKLFDLVSPGEYAAGHVFFEAPPDTHLAPDTPVVLVWRTPERHDLAPVASKTTDNGEDSGKATQSSIANSYYLGADVNNLTEDSNGNALQIAVYTEANTEAPFADRPRGAGAGDGDGGPLRALHVRRRLHPSRAPPRRPNTAPRTTPTPGETAPFCRPP